MKKLFVIFVLLASAALAQSQHSVTLNWGDPQNPAGTTYTIYRATGMCSGTPQFSKLVEGVAEKTYTDLTVQPGNYCYVATATLNGMESPQSNTAAAPVPSFAPQQLQVAEVK